MGRVRGIVIHAQQCPEIAHLETALGPPQPLRQLHSRWRRRSLGFCSVGFGLVAALAIGPLCGTDVVKALVSFIAGKPSSSPSRALRDRQQLPAIHSLRAHMQDIQREPDDASEHMLVPRRMIGGLLLTVAGSTPAVAADMADVITDARQSAKTSSRKADLWNPNSYKVRTQNYNATKLQTYLPILYCCRRVFQDTLSQLRNPALVLTLTNPDAYAVLRSQNRELPVNLLRKEAFRATLWVQNNTAMGAACLRAYERLKRAIDEQDTQCLLLSRFETRVDPAAGKTTRRNLEAVIDALDQLFDTIPENEQAIAIRVAAEVELPTLVFPPTDSFKRKRNTTNTTNTSQTGASTSSNSTGEGNGFFLR